MKGAPRKIDYTEAANLRRAGWTHKQLATRYGVTTSAIERAFAVMRGPKRLASEREARRRYYQATCEDCGDATVNWNDPTKTYRLDHIRCFKCTQIHRREQHLLSRLNAVGDIQCCRCHLHKPIDRYRDDNGFPNSRCKDCETAARLDYRRRHLEESRAYDLDRRRRLRHALADTSPPTL